jgi:hypothetical protein
MFRGINLCLIHTDWLILKRALFACDHIMFLLFDSVGYLPFLLQFLILYFHFIISFDTIEL